MVVGRAAGRTLLSSPQLLCVFCQLRKKRFSLIATLWQFAPKMGQNVNNYIKVRNCVNSKEFLASFFMFNVIYENIA